MPILLGQQPPRLCKVTCYGTPVPRLIDRPQPESGGSQSSPRRPMLALEEYSLLTPLAPALRLTRARSI